MRPLRPSLSPPLLLLFCLLWLLCDFGKWANLSPYQSNFAAAASSVTWREDNIVLSFPGVSVLNGSAPSKLTLTVQSNGPIYANDGGHFRLVLMAEDVVGSSSCIRIGDGMLTVRQQVEQIVFSDNSTNIHSAVPLTDLFSVTVQKLQHVKSSVDWKISYTFTFAETERGRTFFDSPIYTGRHFTGHLNSTGCAVLRTVGSWHDAARWSSNAVPTSNDDVAFTAKAGVVMLPPSSTTVNSLIMIKGLLLAYNSSCPTGWTPNPTGLSSSKCYRLFDELADFDTAEATCQHSNLGSMDAHLVQISDLSEQGVVRRLCRGAIGSLAYVHGCWIGLRDTNGEGQFNWIEPKTVRNNTFRDWRRYEPNNHTFSEGLSTNGELCVAVVPWQTDPLIVEQGSWNDISCKTLKPFVCQMFATTKRGVLNVRSSATLSGGSIEGGILNLNGTTSITSFLAKRTATINLQAPVTAAASTLQNVLLADGSSLVVKSSVQSSGNAYIGEILSSTNFSSMLSTVTMTGSARWTISNNATLNAQTTISGSVTLTSSARIKLLQGGLLSASRFHLADASSSINLGGSSKMSTYDAFEIKSSHRGPVIGEYTGVYKDEVKGLLKGVYRLQVRGKGASETTGCIQYHATAQDVATALAQLSVVKGRGGVTVRRYGDGTNPSFSFGYTYRVEMDAAPTNAFYKGPSDLSIFCYGIANCKCAETKVPLVDDFGQRMCNRRDGNSSRVDPTACVVPPLLIVSRISSLSYMNTSGSGSLKILDGTHRLPPSSTVAISSTTQGTGIVGADSISWRGISVDGRGSIICTGSGWLGWDSATSLWAPEWADYRGKVSLLENAPGFSMIVSKFSVQGLGRVLTASPHSNMTWVSGEWNGGIIGGRSQLSISRLITIGGANKALRYAVTLFIQKQATLLWNGGNISLANGARIVVEGNFTANTTGKVAQYMGMAQLLGAPDANGRELLERESPINWHGYYGNELPMELRGGWYQNPLCGKQCTRTSVLLFQGGTFKLVAHSNTSYSLPVNLEGVSVMSLGSYAVVEMASGGVCGNHVVVNIKSFAFYIFSGGQMAMRRSCTVQGEGELLITGGSHDLSHQIDSHITIAGGAMIWPKSNPAGDTIKFNGGLLISNTGALQVEPFSTTIVVNKTVVFQDDSILQFPMIGVAAQASNSDAQDAPDSSPRGSLTALGAMYWNGGTLRGKADFRAGSLGTTTGKLFIGGGLKQIRSNAKLINYGHAEWDTGDILMADGGDFLNLGTLQKASGSGTFLASDYYQGSITPVESGGDVFALDFHSYDLDQGGLSYTEYVYLRTLYVSEAPPGWKASDQSTKVDTPLNIV